MQAHIIYENEDWMPPLRTALDDAGIPYDEWFINEGHFDVTGAPPEGVFINRMSASSHTRGHTSGVEHTRQMLAWLERHGRRVINGRHAFELEISKVKQHAALEQAGIRTPATRAVIGGPEAWLDAARDMPTPFITKHNRGGKGLGVQLFSSYSELEVAVTQNAIEPSPDGVMLLQQYIQSAEPFITRCEFVDGELVYAITSDTSEGFQLCPAEACRTEPAQNASEAPDSLFALREDVPPALISKYKAFLKREQIDVAGIEFIEDAKGRCWTYDVNGTSNYSRDVEEAHNLSGMAAVADLVAHCLENEAAVA
jgi:glutathione synthase/RimK-type ligase-like ATP-grasp enzyme